MLTRKPVVGSIFASVVLSLLVLGTWTTELVAQCTPAWATGSEIPPGLNGSVEAAVVFDDGSGPALFVGGLFTTAGSTTVNRIAKWNGTAWSALGSPTPGVDSSVYALAVYDPPGAEGPALYVGGQFTTAGGVSASRLAKWDGTTWSALAGVAVNSIVYTLAVYDPPGAIPSSLFVGGQFCIPQTGFARYDGTTLGTVPGGHFLYSEIPPCCPECGCTPGCCPPNLVCGVLYAMAVYDDGSGEQLYAGGFFDIGGNIASPRLVRWDGTNWTSVGNPNGTVRSLAVYDPPGGDGPGLYVGGGFTTISGFGSALRIARYDGAWSTLQSGVSNSLVTTLAVHDSDDGGTNIPELYVGGFFSTVNGVTQNRIAKWNGAAWSGVGSGVGGTSVNALTNFDADGVGPGRTQLFVGGNFTAAGGQSASNISKYGCEPAPSAGACCIPAGNCLIKTPIECAALSGAYRGDGSTCPATPGCGGEGDLDGSGSVNGGDIPCLAACLGTLSLPPECNCDFADLDGDGDVDMDDIDLFVCIAMNTWPVCP